MATRRSQQLLVGLVAAAASAAVYFARGTPAEAPAPPTATATARPTASAAAPTATATAQPSPTATAQPSPTATAEPTPATIRGYTAHVLASGETLEAVAAAQASDAALIARYNHLQQAPKPGQPLIIPQLEGKAGGQDSPPPLVRRGRGDMPWVALTLDAGGTAENVPEVLATLREHHAHITFFLTGEWIRENPELTRQIVADGHEIGNHTLDHPDLTTLDDASIQRELAETEALLHQAAGEAASIRPFFRPPFGAYDERVLRVAVGEGYLPIYWTFDSLDSVGKPKTPEFLVERVTGHLPPDQLRGAIILAHCGLAPTAAALPQILDRLAELGLEVRPISDVL